MDSHYVPDDLKDVQKRRDARKLVVFGVLMFLIGAVGTVLATILKVVWLGILGGPIGALSWLAIVVGAAGAIWGYLMLREASGSS